MLDCDASGVPDECEQDPCGGGFVGDVDGNGVVNALDLAALLSAWGTNDAAADLNDDGTVNAADLAILLSAWSV